MDKCEIRKKYIHEVEKYNELYAYKISDKKIKKQKMRHLKIIKEKIKELEEQLKED